MFNNKSTVSYDAQAGTVLLGFSCQEARVLPVHHRSSTHTELTFSKRFTRWNTVIVAIAIIVICFGTIIVIVIVIVIFSWKRLMKNKKNSSASTFSDALEVMNAATENGTSEILFVHCFNCPQTAQ